MKSRIIAKGQKFTGLSDNPEHIERIIRRLPASWSHVSGYLYAPTHVTVLLNVEPDVKLLWGERGGPTAEFVRLSNGIYREENPYGERNRGPESPVLQMVLARYRDPGMHDFDLYAGPENAPESQRWELLYKYIRRQYVGRLVFHCTQKEEMRYGRELVCMILFGIKNICSLLPRRDEPETPSCVECWWKQQAYGGMSKYIDRRPGPITDVAATFTAYGLQSSDIFYPLKS